VQQPIVAPYHSRLAAAHYCKKRFSKDNML